MCSDSGSFNDSRVMDVYVVVVAVVVVGPLLVLLALEG